MSIFARLLTVLAVCLLPAAGALAADRMFAGSACQPRTGADEIDYNRFGAVNVGASTATVECPFWLPFSGALTVSGVDITVYDRHASENISCSVLIISINGTIINSRAVSSTGFGSGHQFLIANFNNAQALGTLTMNCTIPPSTVNGFSHLTTYRLRTTP